MIKRNIDEWKQLLIGNTYNLLTVTNVIKLDNITMSVCTCKCGNIKYIEPSRVFYGKVKSCGCLNNTENLSSRHTHRHEQKLTELKNQLINSRFCSLVVQDVIINSNNSIVCICKCDCGVIKEIPPKRLMHLKSCGCRLSTALRIKVEDLKKEYIGEEINWFTISDIFRDDNNTIVFKCICKCGNVRCLTKKVILGKHPPMSCGCFKSSDDCRNKHKLACTQEIRHKISESRKKFFIEHPEETNKISERNKKRFDDNPQLRTHIGNKISQWFANGGNSVEQWKSHRRQYYKDHPEIGYKRTELYNNNPEIVQKISDNVKDHWKNNTDEVNRIRRINQEIAKKKRLSQDYTRLLEVIHPKHIDDLLSGNIKAYDKIETKCPNCGKYAEHSTNCYILSLADFKYNKPPLCKECHVKLTSCLTSKYEQEIADYVSTFYSGECVRNNRAILNGKELDLYYPEKRIAIEFNGDYWHDENHKPRDYHYNKFRACLDNNILLISVFESDWNSRKEEIERYIKDTFNGLCNSLSFKEDLIMNNNYPSFECLSRLGEYIEDAYLIDDVHIFTCGYSRIISNT